MSQIQEERRTLATERAQLSSAHRDLISREKLKTETSVQVYISFEFIHRDTVPLTSIASVTNGVIFPSSMV